MNVQGNRNRPLNSNGFTIVELLVVVSVIMIMIALLLPNFTTVREAARRTACLSNQHQIYVSMISSSNDTADRIPLGYMFGMKQYNYALNHNAAVEQSPGPFGFLFAEDHVTEATNPEWLICPSLRGRAFTPFVDSSTDPDPGTHNQWPPALTVPTGVDRTTRVSYSSRPVLNMSQGAGTHGKTGLKKLRSPLYLYTNKTVMSDLVSTSDDIESCHVDGINATYGDGAGLWIQRDTIEGNLVLIGSTMSAAKNPFVLADDGKSGIFNDIDSDY